MDSGTTELRRVQAAARRYAEAREKRDQAIREASDAGVSRRRVAEAAGLAWSRVQQIVSAGPVAALLLVLIFAGSAQASTMIDSPNSIFQHWTDRARVPTPEGAPLRVYQDHPSQAPAHGCSGVVLGCADRDGEWLFVTSLAEHGIRFTFLHELGHIFDARHGTEAMRARFLSIVRRSAWVGDGEEAFADLYAVCARYGLHPHRDARSVSARMHRQGCRVIRATR